MKIEMQLTPIGGVKFPDDVAWQMQNEILFILSGEAITDLDDTFGVEYPPFKTELIDPIRLTVRFLTERATHIITMPFPITTELKEAIKQALLFSGDVKIKEQQGWE